MSDKTTHFLKQKTTGALLLGALLASVCLVLFTKIAHKRVQISKKAVNFV
jgi:hypothetical protein